MAAVLALAALIVTAGPAPERPVPFAVVVVDDQTGRGVPLVELKTVNEIRYVTDSAGVAAIDEPGLIGRSVFFHVRSHGYEFAKDGFGIRGQALKVVAGGGATIRVKRVNVAERLYRVTGGGIYRDSVLVGRPTPIKEPLLNAQVLGQDSVLMARYRGKLHWFWGDTNKPAYPLGNFHTPGAVSDPPGEGGLDPDAGVDLTYYTDANGFARPTAALPGPGPTWLGGLAAFRDETGTERLVAGYAKIRPPLETYERGVVAFDPEKAGFEKVATFPLTAPSYPTGHTLTLKEGDATFLSYTTPFPLTRVRALMADLADPARYESFTCLTPGSTIDRPEFDRAADGALRFAWRANAPAVGPTEQAKFVRQGKMKAGEGLAALRDVETGAAVVAHAGTVAWNAYRGRWIMIAVETMGKPSFLGEVWFAEADSPLGPWAYARRVVTHDRYSFYNPKHHPEFDADGGRRIYFEGTYVTTFSGNIDPTPRYDYNQVMYRLDLSDPRLALPVAVYEPAPGVYATGPEAFRAAGGAPPRFFAREKAAPGSVGLGKGAGGPAFQAVAPGTAEPPKGTVPLYAGAIAAGDSPTYTTAAPVGASPVGQVWPALSSVRLPTGAGKAAP
jgi:hypothetical protein